VATGFDYTVEALQPDVATVYVNGIELVGKEPKLLSHKDKIGVMSPPTIKISKMRIYDFKVTSEDDVTEYLTREPASTIFAVQVKKMPSMASPTLAAASNNNNNSVVGASSSNNVTPAFLQLSNSTPSSPAPTPANLGVSSQHQQITNYISRVLRKPLMSKDEQFIANFLKSVSFVYDTSIAAERMKPLFGGWIKLVLHKDMEIPVPLQRRAVCGGRGINPTCQAVFSGTFSFMDRPKINCALCG